MRSRPLPEGKGNPADSLAGEVLRGAFWAWYDNLGRHVVSNLKLILVWLAGTAVLIPAGFSHPLARLAQVLWFAFCSGAAANLALPGLGLEGKRGAFLKTGGLGLLMILLCFLAVFAGLFYAHLLGGGVPGGLVLGLGIASGLILAGASAYTSACAALGASPSASIRLSLGAAAAFPASSAVLLAAQVLFAVTVLIPVVGLAFGFSLVALVGLLGAERAAARLGLAFGSGRGLADVEEALRNETGRTLRELVRPWEYKR